MYCICSRHWSSHLSDIKIIAAWEKKYHLSHFCWRRNLNWTCFALKYKFSIENRKGILGKWMKNTEKKLRFKFYLAETWNPCSQYVKFWWMQVGFETPQQKIKNGSGCLFQPDNFKLVSTFSLFRRSSGRRISHSPVLFCISQPCYAA